MVNPLSLGFKDRDESLQFAAQVGKAVDVEVYQLAGDKFQVFAAEDTQSPPQLGILIFSNLS